MTLLSVVLFAAFSFVFLSVYQAPLLEIFYDKVATGRLEYNNNIVAAIVTTLLVVLSLWLGKLMKLHGEWTALAYLPSCTLLAFITDIDRSIYTGGKPLYSWLFICLAIALFYLFIIFILPRLHFDKTAKFKTEESNRVLWRNIMLFVLMFCFTGWLSNGEENIKNEALAYVRYKHGRLNEALNVAKRSLVSSQELTSSRAYYMALSDELGDRLFKYPQYYKSEGLLPAVEQNTPLSPDTVYATLGLSRDKGEKALHYLQRAITQDSLPRITTDYYLCALLLDKRITEFVSYLPRYYDMEESDSLPIHYKEALILYSDVISDTLTLKNDTLLYRQYSSMRALEQEHTDLLIRSNFIRREFGHTYWWYYLYSE